MKLTRSESIPSSSSHSQRSILAIDLNQIPSPSETLPSPTSLVRSFHDNHPPADGAPAEIPNDFLSPTCLGCGGDPPDSAAVTLVCDACERGFHFECAGIDGVPSVMEEWICWECAVEGVGSRRWPLGQKMDGGVRLLDMNASPPSDGDGDILRDGRRASCGRDPRKLHLGENFGGCTSGDVLSYSDFIYSGNGFGFNKAPAIVTHADFQDTSHQRHPIATSFVGIPYGSQLGRIRSSNSAFRLPALNPGDVLQSLREFVSERHGILAEGWNVEFKQSKNGCESCAVYCAPDGKVFETMSDVACYLGLTSNGNSMEPLTVNDRSSLRQNGVHPPKRRKLTRRPLGNGFTEYEDSLTCGIKNGFSPNVQTEQFPANKSTKALEAIKCVQGDNGATDYHQFNEALPLQYEDLFILSLGRIDARSSYHDVNEICPVGYRSCWHDKITGSLFLCEVLDGGDSGPVFKVKRFSCSAIPIPYGSTVLHRRSCLQLDCTNTEREKVTASDEDCCIEMFLSEPCVPTESDSLSWLLGDLSDIDGPAPEVSHSQPGGHSSCERSQDLSAHEITFGEKIGEFSVDGCSSSLVWSKLSQKLVDACHQIYKQTGSLKFFCKHMNDGMSSLYNIMNDKNREMFSSLDKFCSLMGSSKVPSVVKGDDEFVYTVEAFKNWMSIDRFGLNTEFVQEVIEQCAEVQRCTRYESLRRRNVFSRSPLVGNGFLLINGKSLMECKQDTALDSLYREYKAKKESVPGDNCRPLGKSLGTKLPPHLVGDVLQVSELLCRFHDILGLKLLNFDELEAELIRPWFESLSQHGSRERYSPGAEVISTGGSAMSELVSSSSGEIDPPERETFIEMETAVAREAHTRLALSGCSKCACVSLRRAHIALLDVLVSELQMKVASVVDPSIDGEPKSRRGRRKDVDCSILAIRSKLNLLPVNELTWPELARRYILAVMAMDGSLDSVETDARECGKVFRCLQGDGGVLCGSLVGVVGIEADALLLAEATKRIYGSPSSENSILVLEDDDPESASTSKSSSVTESNIPEWAQALEPVKKLPTNVGTRIRKCVNEALDKDPPDWARKILQHSISKEVYKGNASGPTKKAVLSVLADVVSEGLQQKVHIEVKKKTIVSIPDIIMKKCRILLRRAASADEEKVFCNLLGRNLLTSSENDEEGLLGSPAMVPRPLDFRTIDLRLAVGVYGGSHEAFFDDVRELWKNIRTAHADQPDLVQLAETLSKNFESLYEEEVVALVCKLKDYSESNQLTTEAKKEVEDIVASTSDILKAPWDEGVCKVCGVDKDDDSVLLCDTCDAEYHTYCLNPPLGRIPEGNWYCPSCVSGVSMLEASSRSVQFGRRHRRKYNREGIRNYLEELGQLAGVLEQKEYWEFTVEERILLLKILCDETLNSIIIRQHLEQCSEMSSDLQQKLRSLYSEWKSLKQREGMLVTKASKLGLSDPNVAGSANIVGHINEGTSNNTSKWHQSVINERSDNITSYPDDTSQEKGDIDALHSKNQNGRLKLSASEKNVSSDCEAKKSVDLECKLENIIKVVDEDSVPAENHNHHSKLLKRHKDSCFHKSSTSNSQAPETSGADCECSCEVRMHDHGGLDVSPVFDPEHLQAASVSSCCADSYVATEGVPCSNELQICKQDLNALQKDLSSLQQSIASAESQLSKSFMRMEFLGSDDLGRLYWVSAQSGSHPRVIVDNTLALQPTRQVSLPIEPFFQHSVPYGSDSHLSLEGSGAACPFVYGRECSAPACSQWVYYESDTEVSKLTKSLKDAHPKERELKDSILHWQKLRFHESHQLGKLDSIPNMEWQVEKSDAPSFPITRAASVLEHKYGSFSQADKVGPLKKRWKRSRSPNDEKLYRCLCLEPIWPSRHHCLNCHKTFFTADDLNKHNDGNCRPSPKVSGKRKPSDEPLARTPETQQFAVGLDTVEASKNAGSDLSRLIKFQNEESMCPYKFEEISSKFVTNDSIKELVHGIGLIGSGGTPSFVPSVSPYLSDPALTVLPQKDDVVSAEHCKTPEKAVAEGDQIIGKVHNDKVIDIRSQGSQLDKKGDNVEADQSSQGVRKGRGKPQNLSYSASTVAVDLFSTVPESSLRPLTGRDCQVLRQLKISLLDMEAALPEEAFRVSKVHSERRRAWHAFVKAAKTIYEMVQATIVLEDMIRTETLKNEWWYWSSLSAAAKTSTLSALALRIYALDHAIVYERSGSVQNQTSSLKANGDVGQQTVSNLDSSERLRQSKRVNKKRKEAEG